MFYGVIFSINSFIQPVSVRARLDLSQLGWLYGGFTAASAGVNYHAGSIADRIDRQRWYRYLLPGLGIFLVGATFVSPLALLPGFSLMRTVMYATQALDDEYVNDRIESVGRATILSAVSMTISLLIVPVKLVAGPLGDVTSPRTTIALLGGFFVFVGILIRSVEPLSFGSS